MPSTSISSVACCILLTWRITTRLAKDWTSSLAISSSGLGSFTGALERASGMEWLRPFRHMVEKTNGDSRSFKRWSLGFSTASRVYLSRIVTNA